jgi:RNA polymerase sigma-70 factor, ECF subfamily
MFVWATSNLHGRMRPTIADINDLLRRVATGDRTAFAALYNATAGKLYGTALRILKRADLADDVVQEAYVRIWANAAAFDPAKASPITWMVTIVRNRAIDELRRAKPISTDEAPETLDIRDPQPLALEVLEMNSDLARLARCLDALEPERRAMVKLAYLEGWSREELSRKFNHPVATVKTWLHRSLKQLKTCLST